MNNKQPIPYDLEKLRARLPRDRGELFLGFVPWQDDADKGWHHSVRSELSETPQRPLRRVVWDNPDDRAQRVLIDVVDCASPEDALTALVDRLLWNQLQELPEGPQNLGHAAFMHPEGLPPAILFMRANLCIFVSSFGSTPVDVLPWAQRLHRRLEDRPSEARDSIELLLSGKETSIPARREVALRYRVPWKYGPNAHLRFVATGGLLSVREKVVHLSAVQPGTVTVEAYLLEPGREPLMGRLPLRAE